MAKIKKQVVGSDVLLTDESREISQDIVAIWAKGAYLANSYCQDRVKNFHEHN